MMVWLLDSIVKKKVENRKKKIEEIIVKDRDKERYKQHNLTYNEQHSNTYVHVKRVGDCFRCTYAFDYIKEVALGGMCWDEERTKELYAFTFTKEDEVFQKLKQDFIRYQNYQNQRKKEKWLKELMEIEVALQTVNERIHQTKAIMEQKQKELETLARTHDIALVRAVSLDEESELEVFELEKKELTNQKNNYLSKLKTLSSLS